MTATEFQWKNTEIQWLVEEALDGERSSAPIFWVRKVPQEPFEKLRIE